MKTDKEQINRKYHFLGKPEKYLLRYMATTGQLGLLMIANILIWFFLVRFIVNKLGTARELQIIGIIAGIISGAYSCYRFLAYKIFKEDNGS